MANEITNARTKIKTKLDIPDSTFDAMLLECIEQAVPRLAPWLQYQLAEDTSVTLATNDDSFLMPATTHQLQKLFTRTSTNEVWQERDIWRQQRNKIYLFDGVGTTTYVKLLSNRPFVYSDADLALLATDYPAAMLPLYLFAMAEFATMIVGNKRKYNLYQQMNGSRTLDEMKDLVDFYENRAINLLENEISAEGQ